MDPVTIAVIAALLATLGVFAAFMASRQLNCLINDLESITLPAM